jgi:hypothetical protein
VEDDDDNDSWFMITDYGYEWMHGVIVLDGVRVSVANKLWDGIAHLKMELLIAKWAVPLIRTIQSEKRKGGRDVDLDPAMDHVFLLFVCHISAMPYGHICTKLGILTHPVYAHPSPTHKEVGTHNTQEIGSQNKNQESPYHLNVPCYT